MLWLKALKNCTLRGIKALLISTVIAIGIIIGGLLVVMVVGLVINGILALMGPDLCGAIGGWFDKHIVWLFGGLILCAAAIPAWDSLVIEKRRLERKEMDAGND